MGHITIKLVRSHFAVVKVETLLSACGVLSKHIQRQTSDKISNTYHTFMDGHTHDHVFVSSINLQSIMRLRQRKKRGLSQLDTNVFTIKISNLKPNRGEQDRF